MKKNLKKRLKIIMSVALLNILLLCIALYQLHTLDKVPQDTATVLPTQTPVVTLPSATPVFTATPAPSQTPEIVTIDTSSDNSLQRIVNSSVPLNKEYIPENLVQFENTDQFIRAEAVTPLQQFRQQHKMGIVYTWSADIEAMMNRFICIMSILKDMEPTMLTVLTTNLVRVNTSLV